MSEQQGRTLEKLQDIIKNVRQIKDIIKMQQNYTAPAENGERVCISELIESAIDINSSGIERHNIEVIREYEDIGNAYIDRQRFLHVMVNLIDNAENALVKPGHYAIRISAAADFTPEISIDGQTWVECRPAAGFWWHDYNNIPAGTHTLEARIKKGKKLIKKVYRSCVCK